MRNLTTYAPQPAPPAFGTFENWVENCETSLIKMFWKSVDKEAQRIWDMQVAFTMDFFMGVEIDGMMQ